MTEWTRVLDQLERQLRRQESALHRSGRLPEILQLERPTSAMSEAELVRATDLMQRTDALIGETLDAMAPMRRPSSSPYG